MARTKSVRIKAKRGRPRQEGFREPNGRLSRAQEPADKLATETRARQMGITVEQARDQKAASFIGYLALMGPTDGLSPQQYQAAVAFQELYRQYQRSIQSPGAIYDPHAMGGEGLDPDAYAEWVKRINERMNAARAVVMEAQFEHKHENLLAAADYVLMRDEPMHHLIGATRILCNRLVHHFRIGDGSARRAA